MNYTHDVTCNLSRWNNRGNSFFFNVFICNFFKWGNERSIKTKTKVFLNKLYIAYDYLSFPWLEHSFKTFLSEKYKSEEKIAPVEREELVLNKSEVAKCVSITFLFQLLSKILTYLNTWLGGYGTSNRKQPPNFEDSFKT